MNKRTLMVLLTAVVACGGQPASQDLTEADHAGIRAFFDALDAALTPEDNRVWSELHTEDVAILMDSTHIKGRPALYEWGENGSLYSQSVEMSEFVIRGSGDIAWVTYRSQFNLAETDAPNDFHTLTVLRRGADGTWRAEAWASVAQ